jgi:N-acetyl-anhydromuramyl-L-alanine amidase AmpD
MLLRKVRGLFFISINNCFLISFFRRLGGSESVQRAYTCYGYKVDKLTSTSPDKQTKVIREFNFKSI